MTYVCHDVLHVCDEVLQVMSGLADERIRTLDKLRLVLLYALRYQKVCVRLCVHVCMCV